MNYDLLVSKAANGVLYDILDQNIYQLVHGQLEDQLVVDVGANKGVFAYFAIHVHKKLHRYWLLNLPLRITKTF